MIDVSKVSWDTLPQEAKDAILREFEDALGLTPDRVAEFYNLSREENPDRDANWRYRDVVGKFEHFWRTDRGWKGAVDVVWEELQPLVESVVHQTLDAVLER